MAEQVVFAIAAIVALGCGALVITLRDPFRAAVALIGTLLAVAVIFLLLGAPFVAMLQVIVYAGAIVVLFLFVIAYFGARQAIAEPDPLARTQGLGWLAVIAVGALGGIMLARSNLALRADPTDQEVSIGSPEAIGRAFIDSHIVPFEATSFVLLVAAIGAVLLAKRAVRFEGGR